MSVTTTDNVDLHRFEVYDDAELAGFVTYRSDTDAISLLHTQIDPQFRGRGLASTLVRHALDEARGRRLAVLPHCGLVRQWIADHPEYVDLVPESRRAEFDLEGTPT